MAGLDSNDLADDIGMSLDGISKSQHNGTA